MTHVHILSTAIFASVLIRIYEKKPQFKPDTKEELRIAIKEYNMCKLWGIIRYGKINSWDVSFSQ